MKASSQPLGSSLSLAVKHTLAEKSKSLLRLPIGDAHVYSELEVSWTIFIDMGDNQLNSFAPTYCKRSSLETLNKPIQRLITTF